MLSIDHGTAVTRDDHGHFIRQYTLTYEKTSAGGEPVKVTRRLPAHGIDTVGRVIGRMADRGEVWNIRVTDSTGADVTQEFRCFRD